MPLVFANFVFFTKLSYRIISQIPDRENLAWNSSKSDKLLNTKHDYNFSLSSIQLYIITHNAIQAKFNSNIFPDFRCFANFGPET